MDVRGKAPATEGDGSEAHLVEYLRSLREVSGGGVLPSGPGEPSSCISLPAFPTQHPYLAFTEHRTYQIRHAPTLKAMTFLDRAGDEVLFFFIYYLSTPIIRYCTDDFFVSFSSSPCSGGRSSQNILLGLGRLCFPDTCYA